MGVEWLMILHHSKKVLGWIPGLDVGLFCLKLSLILRKLPQINNKTKKTDLSTLDETKIFMYDWIPTLSVMEFDPGTCMNVDI